MSEALRNHYERGGELSADVQRLARKLDLPLVTGGKALLFASDAAALAEAVVEQETARDHEECASFCRLPSGQRISEKAERTGEGYFVERAPCNGDFQRVSVWRDEDGAWVRSHPTDDRRGPIDVSADVEIRAYTLAEEQDRAQRDSLNGVIAAG